MTTDVTTEGGRTQEGIVGHVKDGGLIQSVMGSHWTLLSSGMTRSDECLKKDHSGCWVKNRLYTIQEVTDMLQARDDDDVHRGINVEDGRGIIRLNACFEATSTNGILCASQYTPIHTNTKCEQWLPINLSSKGSSVFYLCISQLDEDFCPLVPKNIYILSCGDEEGSTI